MTREDWMWSVRIGILMFLLFWLCCFIISGCAKPKPVTSVPTAPTNLSVKMVVK